MIMTHDVLNIVLQRRMTIRKVLRKVRETVRGPFCPFGREYTVQMSRVVSGRFPEGETMAFEERNKGPPEVVRLVFPSLAPGFSLASPVREAPREIISGQVHGAFQEGMNEDRKTVRGWSTGHLHCGKCWLFL